MGNLEMYGKWLVIAGVVLALLGAVVWLLGKFTGWESLPGTLRIQGSGFTCVVPVLASIVGSVLLTVVLNLIVRLMKK
ncbi:MAG: DUF2905 domain-containing protein [Anaerolineaceae bacterium]|jgi:hypothetical protein|nr:DUF2905 domain-containing protein [Anaerolineaceae bacterium]